MTPATFAKEAVRHLHRDPRPVTSLGIGTERTTVGEILERGESESDHVVTRVLPEFRDEGDAAQA